jgi:PAS domain S-box-containing protein
LLREKTQRRARILLGKEKDLLQTLMDSIPDTIYFKDTHSRFTRVNQAKADEIGISDPSEAIGKSDFDYFRKEDALEAFNDEQKIINTGTPLINKIENRINENGETNWYSATKVPIIEKRKKTIIGTVGITRNITEQIVVEKKLAKAKQQAEESDRLKSAFLANMSHEIRTPMNAILGFSDLLDDNDLEEEEKKTYIQYIKNNGKTLLKLIDDIIDVSKIESNEMKIHRTRFYLNKIFDELYTYYETENKRVNNEQVQLIIKKDKDNFFTIKSDEVRLKQIISNLLTNAIKFTNEGEIEFGYFVEYDKKIIIYVKDSGIGIEEDKHEQIFKRFHHYADMPEKDYYGTGLGLSISKHLVELLGGEIWVESSPGKGSKFSFSLPVNEEQ